MCEQPRRPGEVQRQEHKPLDGERQLQAHASAERVDLEQAEQYEAVEHEEYCRKPRLIGPARREHQLPGPDVDELEHVAKAEPEGKRAGDGEERGADLVHTGLDEDAADEPGCLRREVVVTHETVGERRGIRIEVLLHHEQRRHDRDHDVRRQEKRLQRTVDFAIAASRGDGDAAPRRRILSVGPSAATTERRVDVRPGRHSRRSARSPPARTSISTLTAATHAGKTKTIPRKYDTLSISASATT